MSEENTGEFLIRFLEECSESEYIKFPWDKCEPVKDHDDKNFPWIVENLDIYSPEFLRIT